MRCPANVLRYIQAEAGGAFLACVCRKVRQDLLGVTNEVWRHFNSREISTRDCYARFGATGRLRIHMYAQHRNINQLTRLVLDASVLAQLEQLHVYISPDYRQLAHMLGRYSASQLKYPRFALILPAGAEDAPAAVSAAPFLSRLSIDLGSSRWNSDYDFDDPPRWSRRSRKKVAEQMTWSVPAALFAAGSALRTLLIRGIGFPSAALMDRTFGNLDSFTYQGPATLYSSQIDSVLRLAVRLRSLSIRCHEFIDNAIGRSPTDITSAARIENVVTGQSYVNKDAGEAGIVWYFWNRGVRDIAVSLSLPDFISDQWNAAFPSTISHISCSDGGMSLHYRDTRVDDDAAAPGTRSSAPTRRLRFMTDDLRTSSNMFLHSLRSVDQRQLTSLSIHEYAFNDLFYGIPDPVALQSLPGQLGMPPFWTPQLAAMAQTAGLNLAAFGIPPLQLQPLPPARSFRFPNVVQLTVWLATCAQYRDCLHAFMGMPGSHQSFTGIFSMWRSSGAMEEFIPLGQRCAPPEFPQLRTIELSGPATANERSKDEWCQELEHIIITRRGPRFRESREGRNRMRARWCSCPHGVCVTLRDVHDFLLRHGYASQSLSVRLSGMQLVDVDLHNAVLDLRSYVASVVVQKHPAPCDVCQTTDLELLDAEAIFQQLEGGL